MKILVMGLSGSGKSYLSERLQKHLNCVWMNADVLRKMSNDWDFTYGGRVRQANRMKYYADFEIEFNKNTVICDFICAIEDMRSILKPDYIIWMDTVKSSKYKDTDAIFEPPSLIDSKIDHFLNQLPGEFDRVRFMTLKPGGGELARHTDQTDPTWGTTNGKMLRFHMPLKTNDKVVFTSWNNDGKENKYNMGKGECWFLDTRRPHTAINGGDDIRIHLVADVWANDEVRNILI